MRPKFEVGEVVVLQSVLYPDLSGEYLVSACYPPEYGHRSEGGKDITYRSRTYTYDIGLSIEHLGGVTSKWQEPSLRKKHTPGEMTFDNLMASLSSPKLITHQT